MTRIAVLSDIHANALAFNAVYETLLLRADEFWILGDVFGYGPKPRLTYDLLMSIQPTVTLAGNHDWYVLPQDENDAEGRGWLAGPVYRREANGHLSHIGGPRPAAWDVALRHRRSCSPEMFQTIATWPVQRQIGNHFFLAHALFVTEDERDESVRAAQALETRLVSPGDFEAHYINVHAPWHRAALDYPVLHISGHTHNRELWERLRAPDGTWRQIDIEPNTNYDLKAGMIYHINPGSVGQPRNPLVPCASAALIDSETQFITYLEVPYDSETVREQMCALKYPKELYAKTQLLECP